MSSRISAMVVWALAAGLALFWALRFSPASSVPPARVVAMDTAAAPWSRLLGSPPVQEQAAPVAASSRFQLLGVMAPRPGRASDGASGVALIAVDGKPARAYRAGAVIEGEWLLQEIHARGVNFAAVRGGPGFQLEVPPLPSASTGSLPPPPSGLEIHSAPGAPTSAHARFMARHGQTPNLMPQIGAPPTSGQEASTEEEEEEEDDPQAAAVTGPTQALVR